MTGVAFGHSLLDCEVPLVHEDHARAVRVEDLAHDAHVLLRGAELALEDEQHHVGLLDRLFAAEEGEVVHARLGHLRVFLHAGGVHERVVPRRRALPDRERHVQKASHRLRQERLTRTGRTDQEQVRLFDIDIVLGLVRLLVTQAFIMVVNRHRERHLCTILPNDKIVQVRLDFGRERERL